MKELTLTLTEQEVQQLLAGLAEFPYKQTAQLINKIASQVQVTPQVEEEPKAKKAKG